jgi:NAD(P)-dependent dehydrogenase (short-subunit alcohol dehydrogenase family)
VELDLTRPDTLSSAAESSQSVEIIVNCAGILRPSGPLAENAIEMFRCEIETNAIGLLRLAQTFAPILAANGGGAFVQVNSVASLKCFPEFATYSASKAAAYSITQALSAVLATHGTVVISVHPGAIATDMARTAGVWESASPPSVVAEAIIKSLAAPRFHLFPDPQSAKHFGQPYQDFADTVIESELCH